MLESLFGRLAPNQAGALWIGIVVTLVVFGDFDRLLSRRNLCLGGLLLLAPFLVDVLEWNGGRAAIVFTIIYLLTAGYAAWGLVLALRWKPLSWKPNLGERGLTALIAVIVVINAGVAFGRPPDDAGYYTNRGARRWTETGTLPYGDPKLKGPDSPAFGAAATYGPLLYVAHIPFQWLLGAPTNPPEADPKSPTYLQPPVPATQLACFALYLAGLWALFRLLERQTDRPTALGAVALYAASPHIQGLGSDGHVINGLRFISHIAPSSVVLLALMSIRWPVVCGMLLAAAAGVLFYPAFLFPAWLGWWISRKGRDAMRFTAGFAVVGVLLAALVVFFTRAPEGESAIAMFLESTLEHQEGTDQLEYGASGFSFWGTHPRLAAFWQSPLLGTTSLFKPTFLLFASFSLGAFFMARGRSVAQLAGLTGALAAAIQLWKTHATGSYVEWYLPFLMIALFAQRESGGDPSQPDGQRPVAVGATEGG